MKQDLQYQKKVDWSTKVGVMGYSMGGMSTHYTAANP
jgi:dienelactone hydrolase